MARDCPPTPRPSPRKRQRTMEPVPESPRLAEEASSGGGEASPCCGICLQPSAGGNIIRGQIDSCDHYFCFQCIREWSRVESKCPMCKQRFSTILRPAIEGVFNTERVVYVPLRDQQPLDDSMNGFAEESVRSDDDNDSRRDILWVRSVTWVRRTEYVDRTGSGGRSLITTGGSSDGTENSIGSSRLDAQSPTTARMSYGSDDDRVDDGRQSRQYDDQNGEECCEECNGRGSGCALCRGAYTPLDSRESGNEVNTWSDDNSYRNQDNSNVGHYEDPTDIPEDTDQYDLDDVNCALMDGYEGEEREGTGLGSHYRSDDYPSNDDIHYDGNDDDDHLRYNKASSYRYNQDDDSSHPRRSTDSGEHLDGSGDAVTPYWDTDTPAYLTGGSNEDDREKDESWSNGGNSDRDEHDLSCQDHGHYVSDDYDEFGSRSSPERSPISPSYSGVNERRERASHTRRASGNSAGTGSRRSFRSGRDHVSYVDFHGFEVPQEQIRYLEGLYDLEGAFWEDSAVRSKDIRAAALIAIGEILVLARLGFDTLSKESLTRVLQTIDDAVHLGFRLSCLNSFTETCKHILNLLDEIEDLNAQKGHLESCLSRVRAKLNRLDEGLEESIAGHSLPSFLAS